MTMSSLALTKPHMKPAAAITLARHIPRQAEPGQWSEQDWELLDAQTRAAALSAGDDQAAWRTIVRAARTVLRHYSSSFFLVTRFLPRKKRRAVEAIYAAVRYPDEIVDTFPLSPEEHLQRLDRWSADYERALEIGTVREALDAGLPVFVVAFAEVVRTHGIPVEYYRSFLEAMKMDVRPAQFVTVDDLIETYVYGSAIVVGYFLTYVYGPFRPAEFSAAMRSSRNLGIALQLTNFLRDVGEDRHRGRLYLPIALLAEEGLRMDDIRNAPNTPGAQRVVARMARIAEAYYADAERELGSFSPDCVPAIKACIEVYRKLNTRLIASDRSIEVRESVPLLQKFGALPASKYWKLPLAFIL
jgi:15-cis-phytoene synthase